MLFTATHPAAFRSSGSPSFGAEGVMCEDDDCRLFAVFYTIVGSSLIAGALALFAGYAIRNNISYLEEGLLDVEVDTVHEGGYIHIEPPINQHFTSLAGRRKGQAQKQEGVGSVAKAGNVPRS